MSRLLYPLIQLVYRSMEGSLETRIAVHYQQDDILMKDLTANSFGLESAGVWQVRGNGGLVLTAECLHFPCSCQGGMFACPWTQSRS